MFRRHASWPSSDKRNCLLCLLDDRGRSVQDCDVVEKILMLVTVRRFKGCLHLQFISALKITSSVVHFRCHVGESKVESHFNYWMQHEMTSIVTKRNITYFDMSHRSIAFSNNSIVFSYAI
jgi:hypothetical protein